MKKIIGLVGYPGSGKSYVANILKDIGFDVASADEYGHLILDDLHDEIVSEFGNVSLNGKISRPKLSEIVFNNPKKINKLNMIVWPPLLCKLKKFISSSGNKVIDGALLFESGANKLCSEVWFVDAPFSCRLSRVKFRSDGWNGDEKELTRRESHMLTREEFLNKCDYVLKNDNCSKDDLIKRVHQINNRLDGLAVE
jgi:dephospho-CoA kinase